MNTRVGLLVTAMLLTAAINAPISGQHARQRVIVVFHDDVSLQSFGSGRLDARARANPAAWAYLDRAVLGAVQALEVQHGFRADHVYSEAVRGFAAELTDGQNQLKADGVFTGTLSKDLTPVRLVYAGRY